MSYLIKPAGYKALLNLSQTEMGIKKIKDFFQQNLSSELRLRRVTAPLFVLKGMGINDDLNGTERAVTFPIKDLDDSKAEIVHSLAKCKRLTLADYNIEEGYGIYTDMNAIRSDEELGNYVVLDLGNDYVATCGQLKDIQVMENEYLEAGQVLGYVAEPTKYYSVEGSNVYFKLMHDGKAVDPMGYFQ